MALTPEQTKMVEWAAEEAAKGYKSRIESLVNTYRITPGYATKNLVPKLENLQVAFSSEGSPTAGVLDDLLDSLEAIPEGSCLGNGTVSPSDIRKRKKPAVTMTDQGFSINLGSLTEEPLPNHAELGDPTGEEVDPKRAEEVVGEQLRLTGRAPKTLPMTAGAT